MALENPTYLHDLVEAWPVGATDQRHEGDDHIRNAKKAMRNTFPGMAGRAWRVVSRSQNGTLSLTDNMTVQNAGGITLTPDAASVLGNGWACLIRAAGSSVTIDPPNNINGAGSYIVPAGYTALIFSNGSEFFALLMYENVPPTTPSFPSGTKMLFHQTAAPAGWTKDVSAVYNDAAIRVTTGTAATGGADNFTAVFGSSKRTGGTAITTAQMPPHAHGISSMASVTADEEAPDLRAFWSSNSGGNHATESAGGGASHDHGLTMNPKYADVIVCSKN